MQAVILCIMKTMSKSRYKGDKLARLRYIKLFTALVAAFLILFCFIIGVSFVNGNSMYPTAKSGHPVVYFRLQKHFNRGDIVAIKMPSGECLIKRIIAVEGDTVDIRDGVVYINGVAESGDYINGTTEIPEDADADKTSYPITVGVDSVFVLGDNRAVSVDSRSIGAVSESQIKGKIFWMP